MCLPASLRGLVIRIECGCPVVSDKSPYSPCLSFLICEMDSDDRACFLGLIGHARRLELSPHVGLPAGAQALREGPERTLEGGRHSGRPVNLHRLTRRLTGRLTGALREERFISERVTCIPLCCPALAPPRACADCRGHGQRHRKTILLPIMVLNAELRHI